MQWWSAGLALLAVVVAAALLWVMVRTMRQELGGDPQTRAPHCAVWRKEIYRMTNGWASLWA